MKLKDDYFESQLKDAKSIAIAGYDCILRIKLIAEAKRLNKIVEKYDEIDPYDNYARESRAQYTWLVDFASITEEELK